MLRKAATVAVWLGLAGVPILLLAGEVLCVFSQWFARRSADEFLRQNPNAFAAIHARLAQARALWKTRLYEYRPGAHLEMVVSGHRYVVDINSRGFRTPEFTEEKPQKTVRVICIGGSTTVEGETNDQTYPAILGKRLQATYPSYHIEVLNFGISGLRSEHWVNHAEELFRYEPDVVVQYEGVNDLIWGALPRYARNHPWEARFHKSLLFERLVPLREKELDASFVETVNNQARLATLCRMYHAHHIAGSFAVPDYQAAPPETRAALDLSVTDWTSSEGGLRLTRFETYAALLARYNRLLETHVAAGRLTGVRVDEARNHPPRRDLSACRRRGDRPSDRDRRGRLPLPAERWRFDSAGGRGRSHAPRRLVPGTTTPCGPCFPLGPAARLLRPDPRRGPAQRPSPARDPPCSAAMPAPKR
jgi:hypothetical protein